MFLSSLPCSRVYAFSLFFHQPNCESFTDPGYLLWLLAEREIVLFGKLGKAMKDAGKEGLYDAWMLKESDLIQAAARAFGDRLIAERYGTSLIFPSALYFLFVATL